jgi:hypothetical protein
MSYWTSKLIFKLLLQCWTFSSRVTRFVSLSRMPQIWSTSTFLISTSFSFPLLCRIEYDTHSTTSYSYNHEEILEKSEEISLQWWKFSKLIFNISLPQTEILNSSLKQESMSISILQRSPVQTQVVPSSNTKQIKLYSHAIAKIWLSPNSHGYNCQHMSSLSPVFTQRANCQALIKIAFNNTFLAVVSVQLVHLE